MMWLLLEQTPLRLFSLRGKVDRIGIKGLIYTDRLRGCVVAQCAVQFLQL